MAKKNKNAYFDEQLEGEEVIFVFRRHPIVMRKGLVLAMFGPLVGVLPAAIRPELGFGWFFGGLGAGIILGALMLMPAFIAWYFSVFIVTNERFIQITQKGLFHRSIVDLALNQIQSLNYEVHGFQATVLGYGTILVQTYMGDLAIHHIHHPGNIYKKLSVILRDLQIEPIRMNQSPDAQTEPDELDEED